MIRVLSGRLVDAGMFSRLALFLALLWTLAFSLLLAAGPARAQDVPDEEELVLDD